MSDVHHLVAAADQSRRASVFFGAAGKVLGMSTPLLEALEYAAEILPDAKLTFRDIDAQATLLSWRGLTKILRTTEEHRFRTQILTSKLSLREGEITATSAPAGDTLIYRFDIDFSDAVEAQPGSGDVRDDTASSPGESIEEKADQQPAATEEAAVEPVVEREELGLLWLTRFGVLRYSSNEYLELTGYDREDLIDIEVDRLLRLHDLVLNWSDLLESVSEQHPHARVTHVGYLSASGDSRSCSIELEFRARSASRRSEYIEVRLYNTLEEEQALLPPTTEARSLSGNADDERLLLNEVLFRYTIQNSNVGVYWIREDTNTFLYTNPKFQEMTGYSSAELTELPREAIFPNLTAERRKGLWQRLRKQNSFGVRTVLLNRTGERIPVSANATYGTYRGKGLCTILVEDISEQRELEKKAEISQFTLNNSSFGVIWAKPGEPKPVFMNRTMAKLLGYDAADAERLAFTDFMREEDRANIPKLWKRLEEQGKFQVEGYYLRKDGSEMPVRRTANQFEYAGKTMVALYVEDITAERILRDRQELIVMASQKADVGICFVRERDNAVIYANDQFAGLLGYTPEEVLRVTPMDFLVAPGIDQWDTTWKILHDTGRLNVDGIYRRKDGTEFPVFLRAGYFKYEGEAITTVHVEDRREFERIDQERSLNQAAADNAGLGIYYVQEAGNEIVYANARIADLLGYEREVFLRMHPRDFLIDPAPDTWDEAWDALRQNRNVTFSGAYRHRDGNTVPVNLHCGYLEHNGQNLVAIYVEDRSELAASEEERALNQEAFDNASQGIYYVDAHSYDILYANTSMADMLGYSLEEMRSLNLLNYLKIDERVLRTSFQKVIEQGSVDVDRSYFHKDGTLIPVHLHINHLHYQGRDVACVHVEDRRDFQAVQLDLEINQEGVNKAELAIYSVRIDQPDKIYRYNDWTAKLLGYSAAEMKTLDSVALYVDLSREQVRRTVTALRETTNARGETRVRAKNGALIDVSYQITYLKSGDNEIITTILEDITDKKAKQRALEQALAENETLRNQLESENLLLREEIDQHFNLDNIITQSKEYKQVLKQVERVADTDSTVLITGETGTGKELIANALHQYSKRSKRVMTKVNCAALPESLIESELFGHEKGSFTGADARKIGRFELADGGTLFLDEVGEMPLELQPKLLRVLQEGEFERVGSTKTLKVDVRVVAATNRDLKAMVRAGTFREDLYYRLHVFPINNLPLRERAGDIPLLVQFFVERYARSMGREVEEISQDCVDRLMEYTFPGNVRELENLVERSLVLHQGGPLRVMLPD